MAAVSMQAVKRNIALTSSAPTTKNPMKPPSVPTEPCSAISGSRARSCEEIFMHGIARVISSAYSKKSGKMEKDCCADCRFVIDDLVGELKSNRWLRQKFAE